MIGPDELKKLIAGDVAKWRDVITTANLKVR